MARGGSAKKTRPRSAGPAGGLKPRPGGADNARNDSGVSGFGLSELRRLIRLVQRTGIGELEISSGGRTVRISARPGGSFAVDPMAAPGPSPDTIAAPARPAAPAESDRLKAVTSPMVGTFYRAPAPDADPYVEVGTQIEVGQTVCIVEAMKLMNEIESDAKGRIVQILVENAQPVEFGQKLFLVDPAL